MVAWTKSPINRTKKMATCTCGIWITSFQLCCCNLHSMVLRQNRHFLGNNRSSIEVAHISARDGGDFKWKRLSMSRYSSWVPTCGVFDANVKWDFLRSTRFCVRPSSTGLLWALLLYPPRDCVPLCQPRVGASVHLPAVPWAASSSLGPQTPDDMVGHLGTFPE
jgi:hypothetical protein